MFQVISEEEVLVDYKKYFVEQSGLTEYGNYDLFWVFEGCWCNCMSDETAQTIVG